MFNIVNLDYEEDIDAWLANENHVYVGRSTRFDQDNQMGKSIEDKRA